MSPPLTGLVLLLAALSLSMAQEKDGYNLFKDMQRGKGDELERIIRIEDLLHIDHSVQTWPSVGARVQIPNSAKRTINKFKNLKNSRDNEEEVIEEEDEPEPHNTEEDEEDVAASRVLIPRTHVLQREGPGKLKRGAVLWGLRLASSSAQLKHLSDAIWLLRAERFLPLTTSQKGVSSSSQSSPDWCRSLGKSRASYQCK